MCQNKLTTPQRRKKLSAVAMLTAGAVFIVSAVHSPPVAQAETNVPFFETALRNVTNAAASVQVPAEGIITDLSRFFEGTADYITHTAASIRDFIQRIFATPPPPPAPPPQEAAENRADPQEAQPSPPLAPPRIPPPPASLPEEEAVIPEPNAAAERLRPVRETFIVNTNLRVAGNAEIRGDINVAGEMSITEHLRAMNVFVSGRTDTGALTVREGAETRGLLRALGGIQTGGADIDLEGGRILGLEYVRSIEAGDNVVITGEDGHLTISAVNGGVLSLNGLDGNVSLIGIPNQITVTPTGRSLRLSLPQNIDITSSPTFAGLTLTGNLGVGFNQHTPPTSRLHVRGGDLRVDDANNSAALFVQQSTGNVGVGTMVPTVRLDIDGQIRIRGGAPAAGRLLTAAADGTATWEPPVGGGFLPTGTLGQTLRHDGTGWIATSNLLNDGTNVGLGITPTERLHVSGNILGTGWLRVGDGTAAAPTLGFASDPDTGIFRQALDVLGFTTAGIERARIAATGLDIRTGGLLVGGTEIITPARLVRTADGTAATPAISFSGDTGLGLFRPATNTLAIATAGAERMRIDAVGNVGIGTTTPTRRLAIVDPGVGFDRPALNNLAMFTGDVERVRIDSAGNVGIGTTAPAARLDLGTAPAVNTVLAILARQSPPGDTDFRLNVRSGIGTGVDAEFFRIGIDHFTTRNAGISFFRGSAGTGGFLAFDTNDGSERMRINTAGNVGIGITSPTERLHVAGNILGTGWLRVADGTATAPALSFSADTDVGLFRPAADVLGVTTAGLERLRVDATGNVGIGTAAPAAVLHIHDSRTGGGLNALRVHGTVTGPNWAGRIAAGGTNVAFIMGEYNAMAWLGAHNTAMTDWAPFYINPDGLQPLHMGSIGGFAGGPAMTVVNTTGNVGIGTTAPANRLEVRSDGTGSAWHGRIALSNAAIDRQVFMGT